MTVGGGGGGGGKGFHVQRWKKTQIYMTRRAERVKSDDLEDRTSTRYNSEQTPSKGSSLNVTLQL